MSRIRITFQWFLMEKLPVKADWICIRIQSTFEVSFPVFSWFGPKSWPEKLTGKVDWKMEGKGTPFPVNFSTQLFLFSRKKSWLDFRWKSYNFPVNFSGESSQLFMFSDGKATILNKKLPLKVTLKSYPFYFHFPPNFSTQLFPPPEKL